MIWKNGFTRAGKAEKDIEILGSLAQWHKYFAWKPVIVGETKDKHNIKAWLCFIERRLKDEKFKSLIEIAKRCGNNLFEFETEDEDFMPYYWIHDDGWEYRLYNRPTREIR